MIQLVASMQPGEFRAVSKNNLASVAANCAAINVCAVQGIRGLMLWDGAAYDTKRNEVMVWGGGHTDYAGNEVYIFSLNTLTWRRVTEPSPLRIRTGSTPDQGRYEVSDGTEAPVSAHSYDGLLYLPAQDRYLVLPQSDYLSGHAYQRRVFLFDRNSNTWKAGSQPAFLGPEAGTDLLPSGEVVVSHASGVQVYNPATDAWRVLQSRDNTGYGSAGAYHPETGLFIQAGNWPDAKLVYYDTRSPSPQRKAAPLVGNVEWFDINRRVGVAYRKGRLYLWGGGRDVWTVDPKMWRAAKHTAPSGPRYPSPPIWGKWLYAPALDVFVGLRSVNDAVWIYKPSDAIGDTTDTTKIPILQKLIDAGQAIPPGRYRQSLIMSTARALDGAGVTLHHSAAQGKGAIVVAVDGITLDGFTVEDVDGGDNLAAVRVEKPNITIRNLTARRVQTGVLSGNSGLGTIIVENSRFLDLLGGDYGQTHGVYLGFGERAEFRNVTIRKINKGGHTFKARSKSGLVDGGIFAHDGADASRSFDLSNGGDWVIRNVTIQHGPNANTDIFGFGREYKQYPDAVAKEPATHSLLVENSTIINDRQNGVLVSKHAELPNPVFRNCLIVGVPLPPELDGGGNRVFATRAAAGLPASGLP